MAKPFGVSTRFLLEKFPETWLSYINVVPDGPVRVIDADLSTVPTEADKVIQIDGPVPHLMHLEMQPRPDSTFPRRLGRYSYLLDLKHDLHVRSVAVILRPEADGPSLTGRLEQDHPDGGPIHVFHFGVVRAWRQPLESVLAGRLGVLPLAPLADVSVDEAPAVVRAVDERLLRETSPDLAATIMETTLVLAGMRLAREVIEALRQGLQTMNITTESSYYWLAHDKGH
jgi:hypothetical protein